ncbi:TSUP family transporter [Vampirovibrio sp.]|uniref:TSUP family transporter n=1 Tax=Vampirovibrio sp. TaxID=2717857 RepID=UPI0035948870
MSYLLIGIVSVLVSMLTLFSGFGLGTLLLPAFLLFFPAPVAIAATAIVHLANNIFKVFFVGQKADLKTLIAFSLPATVTALIGALLMSQVSALPPWFQYQWLGRVLEVTPVKLVIAFLMAGFACLELNPAFQKLAFPKSWIPVGGALSGFFGGLTGHQGALRSAFLIRAGLDKEAFIGTTVVSAVLIDISRLSIYGVAFFSGHFDLLCKDDQWGLILLGISSAFLGTYLASRFMHKVTLSVIQKLIGTLLIIYALLLGSGVI